MKDILLGTIGVLLFIGYMLCCSFLVKMVFG